MDAAPGLVAILSGLDLDLVNIDNIVLVQGVNNAGSVNLIAVGCAFIDINLSCSDLCSAQDGAVLAFALGGQCAVVDPAVDLIAVLIGTGTVDPLDAIDHGFLGDGEQGIVLQLALQTGLQPGIAEFHLQAIQPIALAQVIVEHLGVEQSSGVDGVVSISIAISVDELCNQQFACGSSAQVSNGLTHL